MDSLGRAAHVRNLGAAPRAVSQQLLGVVAVELVLECAGQSDVALYRPSLLARGKGSVGEALCEGSDDIAVRGAELQHIIDLLGGHAVGVVDHTVGTGDRDDLGTQLGSLRCGTPCYVAEARNGDSGAFEALAGLGEHVLYEVESSEARCLGTQDRTAPRHALTGKNAGVVLACEFLVHTVEEADLATAHAYVACRNVGVDTDVVPQLGHEGLAETHDLSV